MVCLGPSNFLKAVFHKIYLVHSWTLCLIYAIQIFHAFLLNVKSCSPVVSNIQQHATQKKYPSRPSPA